MVQVFLLFRPGFLELSPFLGCVHFSQNHAAFLRLQGLFSSQYFARNDLPIFPFATVGGLRSRLGLLSGAPALRQLWHLGDWIAFEVDMFSKYIILPDYGFGCFFSFPWFVGVLGLSFP